MPENEEFSHRDYTKKGGGRSARDPELALSGAESPDKNAELAEALKEKGTIGSDDTQAKRDARSERRKVESGAATINFGTEDPNLSVIPIPGTETENMIDHDALALMARAEGDRNLAANEGWARDNEVYLYFLQCEFGHQGLYFTEKPRHTSNLPRDKWFSIYKPKPDSEMPLLVRCQVCERLHNRLTPLGATLNFDSTIGFEQDRVYRVPRNPARARKEGISRAFDSRWASNNLWKADHAKKVKEIEAHAAQ